LSFSREVAALEALGEITSILVIGILAEFRISADVETGCCCDGTTSPIQKDVLELELT
jgi:hypothetical protein